MDKLEDARLGDAVVLVTYRRNEPPEVRETTVTKRGTKYLEVEGWTGARFDRRTGRSTYAASNARVWPSREAYEARTAAVATWDKFRRRVGYTAPDGVTADQIQEAAKLLGWDL